MTPDDELRIRAIVREELEGFAQRIGAALCAPAPAAPAIAMPDDLDQAIGLAGAEEDPDRLVLMADAEQQGLAREPVLATIAWRRRELLERAADQREPVVR